MTHASLPAGPGEPTRPPSRFRRRAEWSAVVLLVLFVAVLSTSFLGRAASSKFVGVGSAIGGGGPVAGGGAPSAKASSNATVGSPSPGAVAAPAAPVPASVSEVSAAAAGAPDVLGAREQVTSGREFISTATMTVKADDLSATKLKAINAVEGKGGGLFGEETSFNGTARAQLTFKVPPQHFRGLLTELEGMGELLSQEVKTDDVTQQVIDLESRITAATASLDRTKLLLDKAGSMQEISALDGEVVRRQSELETLRGQQRTLGERTALATIVLTLVDKAPPSMTTTSVPSDKAAHLPGFNDGLQSGWKAFTDAGSVVLAVVGAVLPFMIVVVPMMTIAWVLLRRRDRREARTAARAAGAA